MNIWENRGCQANNNPTVNLNQLGILKNVILPSEETFFSWNRTNSTGKIHPPTRFPRKGNLVQKTEVISCSSFRVTMSFNFESIEKKESIVDH